MNGQLLVNSESWFVTFLASFLIWVMFAAIFVLWLVNGKMKKQQVIHALIASFIAWIVSQSIKSIFPTLRPFQVDGSFPLTLTIPSDSAFPSVHTSAAFALAGSVTRHQRRLGILFIFVAALVGLGRMLGNVHYFADVFGGAIVGIGSVYILEKLHNLGFLKPH